MTNGQIIDQMTAQLRQIEDPRTRRFVAEMVLLRGLDIIEPTLVGIYQKGEFQLIQDHPKCKEADARWDVMVADLRRRVGDVSTDPRLEDDDRDSRLL